MQPAYSIETLSRAFQPLQSSQTPMSGGGRAARLIVRHTSQPHNLEALINTPSGKDRSADTLRFAGAAARAGWLPAAVKAVLLDPEKPISAHCIANDNPERAADRAIERAFADMPQPQEVAFVPSQYVWTPPEDIPPLDWLIGHWLLRDEVTFVVAPGGAGKTTLLVGTALSLVTGKNLLGKEVPGGPKRVWLWNLEDNTAMMTRSVQAAAKLHGIRPGEMADRLFLDTARDGVPLCTAMKTSHGLDVLEPVHKALVMALKEKAIDVVIVDPFVSSHGGNENDNGEMDRVVKDWCKVAQEAGCAVVLCHHTSKAGSAEVNTMSARGAVAMTAAARVVLVINPMSKTEASKLGVDDDEHWRMVQVTMDKSNRAPLEKADWYRKASVTLGPGDSEGAVEPWSPPKAVDLLTPEAITTIKEAFGARDLRESVQSPDWAGYAVADALGLDLPEKSTPARGKVTRMIAELVRQGHLAKGSGKDDKSKSVPVLRAAHPISPPARSGVETSGEVESCEE